MIRKITTARETCLTRTFQTAKEFAAWRNRWEGGDTRETWATLLAGFAPREFGGTAAEMFTQEELDAIPYGRIDSDFFVCQSPEAEESGAEGWNIEPSIYPCAVDIYVDAAAIVVDQSEIPNSEV